MSRFGSLVFLVVLPVLPRPSPSDNRVTIGTIDSTWSPTLKEYRKYWVYTPPSYHDSTYLPRRYPVLYLLDGDAHFIPSRAHPDSRDGVNARSLFPK